MYDAREFGIRVAKESGNEQHCVCPFHSDHSPSASFNRIKGLLYCYVCGRSWNVAELQDALDIAPGSYSSEDALPDFDLLDDEETFDLGEKVYHPYFAERGISREVARLYGIGWKEREPQAAALPITNLKGEVRGVSYRYLAGPTRYKVFGKPTPLWPMHLLLTAVSGKRILVVEGAWSAMRIATVHGCDDILPLALLGAKANQAIVSVLGSFDVTFLYDQDAAGERARDKMIRLFPTARSWTVSPSPDDMSDRQVRNLVRLLFTPEVLA